MKNSQIQSLIKIEINAILQKYQVLLNENNTVNDEVIADMFIHIFIQYINENLSSYDKTSKKFVRKEIIKLINERIK